MSKKFESEFGTIIQPVRIEIKAAKTSGEIWELQYNEWVDVEDEKTLKEAVATTRKLAEFLGFKIKAEGNKISFSISGSFNDVASVITMEFLAFSNIANMTLRDILLFTGIGNKLLSEKIEKGEKKT